MDKMPPCDILVETCGGSGKDRENEIVKDRFSSYVGDWLYNDGDPTHWRLIKKENET